MIVLGRCDYPTLSERSFRNISSPAMASISGPHGKIKNEWIDRWMNELFDAWIDAERGKRGIYFAERTTKEATRIKVGPGAIFHRMTITF